MSTHYTIRAHTTEDVPRIAHLLNALYASEGSASLLGAGDISAMLANTKTVMRIVVAEYNKKLVGCILYYDGFDVQSMQPGIHVADMVVENAHRRQSVGRRLLAYVATEIADAGGAWMSLTCLKENLGGNKFYTALGFQEVSVQFYALGARGMQMLSATQ